MMVCLLASPAGAGEPVDWKVIRTLNLESAPLDVAVSQDGRWIYVLIDSGHVLLYSEAGQLKDRMNVGKDVSAIDAGTAEGILFLSSKSSPSVRIVSVDLEYDFDLKGSPSRGPDGAPVVIAVFSDFQ